MISLHEFHHDFLQSVLSDAESRGLLKSQAFFENVCEELVVSGDLTVNYTVAEYIKTGIEVQGFDYDEERGILTLLIHQFFQEDRITTLTKNAISTKLNRLKNYFKRCIEGVHRNMEETSDAFSMSYTIFSLYTQKEINRLRFVLVTDGRATKNLTEIPPEDLSGIPSEFRVVDIDYIYKTFLSAYTESNFEVSVNLPCLEIPTRSDKYQSYLTYLDGNTVVRIYEQFGQKLFEQNVRTFLQFKGNVNKGIRNTIELTPEMFFAYNNGITATASEVEFSDGGHIVKMTNFQVVNGGQTTSAIYAAKKSSKLDVSNLSVQMKLSVVKEKDKISEHVRKIAEYANTQNKINKSDFFSNSAFHVEMKEYSRRIWAPTPNGTQRRTHWFYERVRGEYLNEQAYLSSSDRKKFQLENPKSQLIDKTFLSKCENSWLQKPHIVSRGAQYSFSAFADNIAEWLDKDRLAITENYFKETVARVILFRQVEKLVSGASWYDNGFRAQTVTYAIAYLSYIVGQTGGFLNFQAIWEGQTVPQQLIEYIEPVAEAVYNVITTPPPGSANVAQWCKKPGCWDAVKKMSLNHPIELDPSLLIGNQQQKTIKREEKKQKKVDNGIEVQGFVVSQPSSVWQRLYGYYCMPENRAGVSSTQLDILGKVAQGALRVPSEKQSRLLYQLYERAVDEAAVSADQ